MNYTAKSLRKLASCEGNPVPYEDRPYLEYLRQWITTCTGLDFPERKRASLYRRLSTLCWKVGIPNLEEMARQLREQTSPQLVGDIVWAVSTSHSFFFREPEVLRHLSQLILQQLPVEGGWRIWSAATATGDEAYTAAILLAEALGLKRAMEKTAILGTDISPPMIEAAERGVYAERNLELVPLSLRKRYFRPVGQDEWQVTPDLKRMCMFRRMNLQSVPWPFGKQFHVILCRNVFYYFDVAHQQKLAQQLYSAAEPGGWLITSVTETLHNVSTRWRKVGAGLFRKL